MRLQNYNEFRQWVRWFDYIAIMLFEFPIILIRRYDWLGEEKSTLTIQFLGFKLYQRTWKWQ